jgi:hypothetical protein
LSQALQPLLSCAEGWTHVSGGWCTILIAFERIETVLIPKIELWRPNDSYAPEINRAMGRIMSMHIENVLLWLQKPWRISSANAGS